MSNTVRKDNHDRIFKEGLKKKSIEAYYGFDCYHCVGIDKRELINKIAKKELKKEIEAMEKFKTAKQLEAETNIGNLVKDKYSAKKFEYKEEDFYKKLLFNLDRFTQLENKEIIEDLDGEYVLFSDVLKLFNS